LKGEWKSTGDPTEVALQVFATKLRLGRARLASDVFEPDEKRGRLLWVKSSRRRKSTSKTENLPRNSL
jgi:hypothetical protein